MKTSLVFSSALVLLASGGVHAQKQAVVVGRAAVTMAPLLSADAHAEMAHARQPSRILRQSLHLLGGGLIGGGIGYFASQVVHSDWERSSDDTFAHRRRTYALLGALVGVAGGALVERHSGPLRPATIPHAAPGSRSIISRIDIDGAAATSAFELVQSLRPDWLVPRGSQRFREAGSASGGEMRASLRVTPGEATIIVYLDNARMGGVDALRQIPAPTVQRIEFLDAAAAQYRFGRGHTHGAIIVSTNPSIR